MRVLVKGMKMPRECADCDFCTCGGHCSALKFRDIEDAILHGTIYGGCPLIPVPDHGDLIDRDELSAAMYHEAFETDSKMQKWDSGCWIRYKMFENKRDNAPVIIPAERSEE